MDHQPLSNIKGITSCYRCGDRIRFFKNKRGKWYPVDFIPQMPNHIPQEPHDCRPTPENTTSMERTAFKHSNRADDHHYDILGIPRPE